MSSSGERRFDVTGLQIMASVLATVTGAVAASYLGVAGTIIGAAVMSVASTAGSAVYKHYLGRSANRLRESAPVVAAHRAAERMSTGTRTTPHRAGAAGSEAEAGSEAGEHADDTGQAVTTSVTATSAARTAAGEPGLGEPGLGEPDPGEAGGAAGGTAGPDRPADRAGWRRWLGWLRGRPGWLAITVASLGIFVGVVGGITVFEVAAGKPLDAVVWHHKGSGTTVGGLVGGQPSQSTAPAKDTPASHRASPSPSPSTRTTSPSPTPSSGSPSPTTSATSPPTTTSPSPSPSVSNTKKGGS